MHNSSDVPFAARRRQTIDKAVKILSADPRFVAGWLEGSLADGSADPYSDIDLYLCLEDDAWQRAWNDRRAIIERIAPILASLEIRGMFGIGCLLEGPVKLDVFFEKARSLEARTRPAVKWLWGPEAISARLKVGDTLDDSAIRFALETLVLGFLQGGTWPVRMLARGQVNTFLFNEILLVETGIIPRFFSSAIAVRSPATCSPARGCSHRPRARSAPRWSIESPTPCAPETSARCATRTSTYFAGSASSRAPHLNDSESGFRRVPSRSWSISTIANGRARLEDAARRHLPDRLLSRAHLRGEYRRMPGARIALRCEHYHLAEPGSPELVKEGATFFCSRDSCEPVIFGGADFRSQRHAQYQLGGVNCSSGTHYSRQLAEDRFARRIQVEDPVDQRDVDRSV
jgi:hypothetical protein